MGDKEKDLPTADSPAPSNVSEQDKWAKGAADGAKKITDEGRGSSSTFHVKG